MESSAGRKNLVLSHRRSAVVLLFLALAVSGSQGASLIHKRSVGQNESEHGTQETCILDNPCGWEVYDAATRNHEYYVTGSCVCPTGEKCVMNSDDLAMSAYIYTCRALSTRKSKTRNRAIGRPNSAPPNTTSSS